MDNSLGVILMLVSLLMFIYREATPVRHTELELMEIFLGVIPESVYLLEL